MYVLNYLVLRSSLSYARLFLFLIAIHSISIMDKGSLDSVLLSVLAFWVILTINIYDFDYAWVIHKCNHLQLFSSKTNKQKAVCAISAHVWESSFIPAMLVMEDRRQSLREQF